MGLQIYALTQLPYYKVRGTLLTKLNFRVIKLEVHF